MCHVAQENGTRVSTLTGTGIHSSVMPDANTYHQIYSEGALHSGRSHSLGNSRDTSNQIPKKNHFLHTLRKLL